MTLAAVVASALLAVTPVAATTSKTAVATVAATDVCRNVLDVTPPSSASPGCASPSSVPSLVLADARTAPRPPRRDPAVLPGELGFFAVAIGLMGGGAMVGAQSTEPQRLDASGRAQQRALFVSGASLVGLAGLVGAGAVATAVFDPATGTLRLPLFAGED